MKTKERILTTSLNLFNTYGEPNVSTVDIAHEMNISPGNLYYHFSNKLEIVLQLFEQFKKKLVPLLDEAERCLQASMDHWLYLHLVFEVIWNYRFFYRDINQLLDKDKLFKKHFNLLINKKKNCSKAVLDFYCQKQIIAITEAQQTALINQITFILTFWYSFEDAYTATQNSDPLNSGIYQIMMLISPYLVQAEQKKVLFTFSKQYLS